MIKLNLYKVIILINVGILLFLIRRFLIIMYVDFVVVFKGEKKGGLI